MQEVKSLCLSLSMSSHTHVPYILEFTPGGLFEGDFKKKKIYIYIYICVCVCVCNV